MGEANLSFTWSEKGIGFLDPSGTPSPKVSKFPPPPPHSRGRGYICPAEEFCWLYQRTSLVYRKKFFSRENIPPAPGGMRGKNSPLMPTIRVVERNVDDSIDSLFSTTVAVSSSCSRSRQVFCSAAQQKQGI